MTPESLETLRSSLPPFTEGGEESDLLREFCRYYSIDFADRDSAIEHLAGTVNSGPYKLCVHLWRQSRARGNLLLVHGYFDHTGLFGKLVEYGLSRNYNVLIFDLPGHGLSSGEAAVIEDFGHYSQSIFDVLAAVRLPDLPLWVMAQSTGCAALVDYAGKHSWPFHAAVLLAPLVRPTGWLRVRAAHSLLRHFVDSIPRKFNRNSSDASFLDFIQRDPMQSTRLSLVWIGALRRWLAQLQARDLGVGPALVLQGNADDTVDWKYNLKFVSSLFGASRVEILDGAGHQLANESSDIRACYLQFVDDWLAGSEPQAMASEQHATANGPLDARQLGEGDVAVLGIDVNNDVAD